MPTPALRIALAGWAAAGLAVLTTATLIACHPRPLPSPAPAATRDGRWQQDIAYLSANLLRLHPQVYAHVAPAAWAQAVAQLQRQVPARTDAELRLGLQQLVALLRDGHTRVARAARPLLTVPIGFRWFPDGVYATVTRGPGQPAGGARLVAVNGIPTAEALERLGRLMSADNAVGRQTKAVQALSEAEPLAFCQLAAATDSVVYSLVGEDGRPRRLALAVRPDSAWQQYSPQRPLRAGAATPLYRQHFNEPFWCTALPARQAVYAQYNECRDAGRFLQFSWQLMRLVQAQRPRRLVLDLRFNEGGASGQFRPLRWWLAHNNVLRQRGQLVVLIGRDTFSSGLRAACELKQHPCAVLVGEATGGCPTAHFTEVKSFRLPNSQLEIQYASRQTNYLPALGTTSALLPDVPAPLTIEDYRQGRDPALEAALRFSP